MMNKKAMVGVIAAVTIAVGGGAGLAGYAMTHSHKAATSAEKTVEKKVPAPMAEAGSSIVKTIDAHAVKESPADMTSEKAATLNSETEALLAQKNAEKAAAEQEMFANIEAETGDTDQKAVIDYLAGSPVYPEAFEVGMMAGDCASDLTNLMGGSTAGEEFELTGDQPILYILNEDGSFELVDFYAPLEAGVKYFTKINVHCADREFSADVKMSDSLQEWHIAAVAGNTITLCSPVVML